MCVIYTVDSSTAETGTDSCLILMYNTMYMCMYVHIVCPKIFAG